MILTTAYFPNLLYFRYIQKAQSLGEDLIIEACENYQKQSYRNRCKIASDKGTCILSIPVHTVNNIPVRDVYIDYTTPWQREHLRTIRTCYGSAPFYPYVMDRTEELFSIKEKWLLDYNLRILERLLKILNLNVTVSFSKSYSKMTENDSRLITSRNYPGHEISGETYFQVFSDRLPFMENLSIIDYMMCEGFCL